MSNETDAASYVGEAMRHRLDIIGSLQQIAGGDADSPEQVEALGLDEFAAPQALYEEADDRLCEMPLAVESTRLFEVVLGTGGPDDRLIFECDLIDPALSQQDPAYELRRVLYRYSWDGSAEVELTGEDRLVAVEFARRVVPELTEVGWIEAGDMGTSDGLGA